MKSEVKVMRDGRVILSGTAYRKMKIMLRDIAGSRCELGCGKCTLNGDPHHGKLRGMGGAKRDDRIFVNGERQMFYACRECHSGKHVPRKVLPAKVTDSELMELLGVERKEQ